MGRSVKLYPDRNLIPAILRIAVIFCAITAVSCSNSRHAKKVATDVKHISENKLILSPWVSLHFPPIIKPNKPDTLTIVDIDTVEVFRIADTFHIAHTEYKDRIITRNLTRIIRDTITIESRGEADNLRFQLATSEGTNARLQENVNGLKDQVAVLKRSKYFWLWIVIALVVIDIVFICYKVFK